MEDFNKTPNYVDFMSRTRHVIVLELFTIDDTNNPLIRYFRELFSMSPLFGLK